MFSLKEISVLPSRDCSNHDNLGLIISKQFEVIIIPTTVCVLLAIFQYLQQLSHGFVAEN